MSTPAWQHRTLLSIVERAYDRAFPPRPDSDPYWRRAVVRLARELIDAKQLLQIEDLVGLAKNQDRIREALLAAQRPYSASWTALRPGVRRQLADELRYALRVGA